MKSENSHKTSGKSSKGPSGKRNPTHWGDSIIKVDVRIIAATNKDLWKMVQEGKFRKDLFFRLNVFQINIPPLRERRSDIKHLIDAQFAKLGIEYSIDKSFNTFCSNYDWPGNVRELKNILEYIVQTTGSGHLSFKDLPVYLKQKKYILDMQNQSNDRSFQLTLLKLLKHLMENGKTPGEEV